MATWSLRPESRCQMWIILTSNSLTLCEVIASITNVKECVVTFLNHRTQENSCTGYYRSTLATSSNKASNGRANTRYERVTTLNDQGCF
jgi:hypothetical protein